MGKPVNQITCRIMAPWIAAGVLEGSTHMAPVRDHIRVCLRCQAALVRKRRHDQSSQVVSGVDGASSNQRVRVLGALGGAAAVAIGIASVRRSLAG